ncbi:tryptophan synthase subunit alpha [soil metagenome]
MTDAGSPLTRTFAACREEGRAALVLYVTAGHPSPAATSEVLRMLAEAGADIIELGVPFSDPLADGPTIQRSSFEAIAQGADLAWTLETLARFRSEHATPVVLFSYLNPILRYGTERFLRDAAAAGAEGVLVTDLPAGADPELERAFADSPLDLIRLIAPTTRPERVREIAASARGFLYYVSRTGVTGAREALAENLTREVAEIRALTDLPVAVGFGISTPEQAAEVARVADGVVVGSALVDMLGREGVEEARRFVTSISQAMRL